MQRQRFNKGAKMINLKNLVIGNKELANQKAGTKY
jgi:hypothetical protein